MICVVNNSYFQLLKYTILKPQIYTDPRGTFVTSIFSNFDLFQLRTFPISNFSNFEHTECNKNKHTECNNWLEISTGWHSGLQHTECSKNKHTECNKNKHTECKKNKHTECNKNKNKVFWRKTKFLKKTKNFGEKQNFSTFFPVQPPIKTFPLAGTVNMQ